MSYNYNPLWKTLEQSNLSTYYLINHGVNSRTINKLKHNKNTTIETLDLICSILECRIEDVVEVVNE